MAADSSFFMWLINSAASAWRFVWTGLQVVDVIGTIEDLLRFSFSAYQPAE
jgi:hypothetical protein